MQHYKIDFIKFLVKADALKFGTFTLKSGRVAPYFLNVGSFHTGEQIHTLAKFYAEALLNSGVEVDVLFGPAYKGIPLATVTTSVLFSQFGKSIAYCFNRKEAKDHGEKNILVGAPLTKTTKVMLVDDVITAGTAIRETIELLKNTGNPKIAGILISLNRMEKNNDGVNAIEQLQQQLGIQVYSIINLDEVIEVLYNKDIDGTVYIDDEKMSSIKEYRKQYGI